jgi:predicted ester cyclase
LPPRSSIAPPSRACRRRAKVKQSIVALKTAFPDLRYTVEDAIACGDQIVHRLSATGTMKGDFMGIPATGKRASWTEIHIGRSVEGRLTEHWAVVDQLGMLVQLGVVPAPGRTPVTV